MKLNWFNRVGMKLHVVIVIHG